MKLSKKFFLFLLLALMIAKPELYAGVINVLGNSSFEVDVGGTGNWDDTANRGITTPEVTDAPDGNRVLRLSEAGTGGGQFPFTFQTVSPASPGDIVAITGFGREVNLDDGDDDGQIRIEFQTSAGALITDVITSLNGAAFQKYTASGVAPAGTGQITFTLRIQNSEAGGLSVVEFDNMNATISSVPLLINATPSNLTANPGETRIVALNVQNGSLDELANVEVVVNPPAGVIVNRDLAEFANNKVTSRDGSIIFQLGTLISGQNSVFSFPVVLTSGILPGKSYELTLFGRAAAGQNSAPVSILIRRELDPVFDEGTIIGKVFNDRNGNGVQDKCAPVGTEEGCSAKEEGVPWVRLMTEEGIEIITDENGKYHIPAVKPGRHVIKIDGHSLPEGTVFITEESYLVRTTPGILSKANFAVQLPPSKLPKSFQDDLKVSVTQGVDTTPPQLDVSMDPGLVKAALGRLEKDVVFSFNLNYRDFIRNWFLEIRDEMGREVWTGFGVATPPAEVVWSGQTESGLLIAPGTYSYQFKVEDKEGHQDWTALKFFRVISKADELKEKKRVTEIPPIGDFNVFKDGKRSIPLIAKPTIRVQGKTAPKNTVTVNRQRIKVDPATGYFRTEIYTSPGEKEIIVTATTPDGESTTYSEMTKVKDSTFFMVALGEQEFGHNILGGNFETIAEDDQFKHGFYEDGRLSYALRGKLKGKFLFKSHYDTEESRSRLFTNLDPDDYYPVYGDNSVRNYDAQNSNQKFYMLVEMDRSFAMWGSFKTAFNQTELSTYNRTLSGFKVHHESIESTRYGDPKRGFTIFSANAGHRASHDEFAATGGSLYYLRNRGVIEGSEKIRVEVRDKIQNITVASEDFFEGRDYEIDYDEGRILLSRPLSSVAASDTLIADDILDGNPVFLIVDYEYDIGTGVLKNRNQGIRGFVHMGDHIRIGGTAVNEQRTSTDYDLRGLDATIKLGRNTKITAEYAETKQEQVGQSVSFNGGLTFSDLNLIRGQNTRSRENAYLVKAESQPIKGLNVSGYVQGVEPSFSTDRIKSQEGTKKYGVQTKYKFNDVMWARYRFDNAEVADQLFPLSANGVVADVENIQTHVAQVVYDDGRWLAQGEYRHLDKNLPEDSQALNTRLSELTFKNGLSGKVGYRINEKLMAYSKVQVAINEQANHQFGGGIRYEIGKSVFAYIEQMFGNFGDSTFFGFEKEHKPGVTSYMNLRMFDRGIGLPTVTSSIGSSASISPRSRIFSEREHSSYEGVDGFADILGFQGRISDHWDIEGKFERRHLDGSHSQQIDVTANQNLARSNTTNTVSVAAAYADGVKTKARTSFELRRDQDTPELLQVVTRNSLEYKINQDLTFLGKLDYGNSRFLNPGETPADFMEVNTGFAYRPVDNDKLNVLMRYSYIRDVASDAQFNTGLFSGVELDQTAHIIAIDIAYDLHRNLQLVEKFAYKSGTLNSSVADEIILHNLLMIHRMNFHVTRKWDIALEYRALWQFDAAKTLKQGALVEVDREIFDYARLGVGYNFTDFDDDVITENDFDSHGPFVRLTGKF